MSRGTFLPLIRQLVIVEGVLKGDTMQRSLDGENYSNSVPTATNAGDYTVWYKVMGEFSLTC